MPRYVKTSGEKVPNLKMEKAWIVIPVKAGADTMPVNNETYLVQPRVADYIEKLERKILKAKGELPMLPIKK